MSRKELDSILSEQSGDTFLKIDCGGNYIYFFSLDVFGVSNIPQVKDAVEDDNNSGSILITAAVPLMGGKIPGSNLVTARVSGKLISTLYPGNLGKVEAVAMAKEFRRIHIGKEIAGE